MAVLAVRQDSPPDPLTTERLFSYYENASSNLGGQPCTSSTAPNYGSLSPAPSAVRTAAAPWSTAKDASAAPSAASPVADSLFRGWTARPASGYDGYRCRNRPPSPSSPSAASSTRPTPRRWPAAWRPEAPVSWPGPRRAPRPLSSTPAPSPTSLTARRATSPAWPAASRPAPPSSLPAATPRPSQITPPNSPAPTSCWATKPSRRSPTCCWNACLPPGSPPPVAPHP